MKKTLSLFQGWILFLVIFSISIMFAAVFLVYEENVMIEKHLKTIHQITETLTEQTRLSQNRIARTINDLKVNESGWTVPWAMQCIRYRCFLNDKYSLSEPGGTVDMKITRKSNGYIADISQSTYLWNISSGNKIYQQKAPVVKIIDKK